MPSQNAAKKVKTTKGAGGKTVVNYVKPNGQSVQAEVTGGTHPNLNLKLTNPHPKSVTVKTGVAKRTAMNQTNVWYSYL